MSEFSRRRWLTAAGALAAAAALAGAASAQGSLSADEFIRMAKSARVFDLSFVWNDQSPVLGLNPPYAFALNRTHAMTHEIFGQVPGSQVSWASDIMYFSGQHGSPTLDAIGHIGRNLKLYGGVDARTATSTPGGIGANLGVEAFPADLLINRVVFLDVARHVANGRADPLPADFEITAKHLEDTMRAQGVEVNRGDSLLIRTGWGQFFGKDNAKFLGQQSPGPGQDGARWIIGKGVRLAGDDTATFEKRPAAYGKELFSVHMMLLADNGIYIVENANLEPLSEAKDGESIEVRACLVQLFRKNPFFEVCPTCGVRMKNKAGKWVCDQHGDVKPSYNVVVSGVLDDGYGNVRVVFFRELAEKLFGKSASELRAFAQERVDPMAIYDAFDLLGKDYVIRGRVRKNDLTENLELIANGIEEPDVKREFEMLMKEIG